MNLVNKTAWLVTLFTAALLGFVFLLPTPQSRPAPFEIPTGNTFTVHNVNVFDGTDWRHNTRLHIVDGKIAREAAPAARHIDGEQRYIIPGLIDAHTHTWGNALTQALRFGVTTELDMFTDYRFLQARKGERDSFASRTEADFFSATTLITSPGGHGTEYGMDIPTIVASEQAEAFVSARIAQGADYIKIVYDANPAKSASSQKFTSIDYATMAAVIEAAHANQLLAVVHIMDAASAQDAVEAGADGLVHGFAGQPIEASLLHALKQRDVFVIPTLSVLAGIAGEDREKALLNSPYFSAHITPRMKNAMSTQYQPHGLPTGYFQTALNNVRAMHEYGITLLAGTDAPNLALDHGISLHDELALLVLSGLSETEALKAATSNVTESFSVGSRGTLHTGARADFLVLDKDPRHDIQYTQSMVMVAKNGFARAPFDTTDNAQALLSEQGKVSQFDRENLAPRFGHKFVASTDAMMQGDSTAALQLIPTGCAAGQALQISGTVGRKFPYPWSGLLWQLSETMQQGENVSNFNRISFNAKGQPGQYRLMILTPDSPQPVEQRFEVTHVCSRVTLAFADFDSVDWNNISGIGWMAGPATPEYRIQLDSIALEK